MIRYNYNRQVEPPAPFIYVSLRCPKTGQSAENVPAQIDTGADRTVIQGRLAEVLELAPLDELEIAGLGGQVFRTHTYLLELAIHTLEHRRIEVVSHGDEPYILIGRDVLNQHRLLLDGPGLALEIH